jgi:hypothetical protein
MALLGSAALAMWWNMAPQHRADFEDWHTHEHFPERLAIPGFRRGSRWTCADGGEGVFVMYELASFAVLSSDAYLARLNAPTPWSARLMPLHRDMVRSQCHVLATAGGTVARHALTLRLTPRAGRAEALQGWLDSLGETLSARPGLGGAHLLRHETPAIAVTAEQRIRGLADHSADWVFVVAAYDEAALRSLNDDMLSASALAQAGAEDTPTCGLYTLSYSAIAAELS